VSARGSVYEGQPVEFDAGRGRGTVQAVAVSFAGKRWVCRTTDGKTWRVPATMLRPAKLDATTAQAVLAAGEAREEARSEARGERAEQQHADLAPRAAEFRPGMTVDVVHRGRWGWTATVVRVGGGKVTVTNPTRALFERAEASGLDAHRGRRTTATVTLWANRVRRPGERRDDMFTLLGF